MKRILTTTTAFAVALSAMQPLPAFAEQGNCMPGLPCDASDAAKQKAQQEAERKAQEEAERAAAQAAQQEQEAARAADEAAAADHAREQAEADQKAAEQAARDQAEAAAKAEADAAAQAQAEADVRAQAEAEQKAADEAAAADAARQQQAEADAAAAAAEAEAQQKAAEADQAADDAAKAAEAAAQEAAESPTPDATPDVAEGQADQPVILPAPTEDAATAEDAAAPETAPTEEAVEATPDAEATEPAKPAQTARDGGVLSPFPTAPAEPTQEQVKTLDSILQQPAVVDGAEAPAEAPPAAAAAAEAAPTTDGKPLDAAPSPDAVVTTETLTEENTRTSDKDFTLRPDGMIPAPKTGSGTETADRPRARKDDDGMSDLAKVGLVALGALAVGALLSDGREVVQNSGDRVVLRDDDGRYYVYKDDDAVMRRPGSTVRTEQYGDGSTRTIVERRDGTQVVTIRDASGRVLRRTSYDQRGREIVLFDDMVVERPIVVSELPRPRAERMTLSASDQDAALRARMLAEETRAELGRGFSLRQIRDIPQVRDLAAMVDVDNITFETGSAAIRPAQAETLASLGRFIKQLLAENPGEVFLIEGHTDAVGSDYSNLALSDRRAESVALALTEYFDVPPENLVVQGYGESDLRIDTPSAEPLNRRVAVRVITPLLQTAAAN